ncbi:MAG: hypothetical protein Kow0029_18300 [Candidatus Rifleibacteriota bacterium]
MKCEEFRDLIVSEKADLPELEKHLEACEACSKWLDSELATPPEGLTSAEWISATARCMPAIENKISIESATPTEEPIRSGFFEGLKYGFVFGLSIIFGLAIVQVSTDHKLAKSEQNLEMVSFLDDSNDEIPVFFEKNFSDVTFLDFEESKMVSFMETEQIPSFLEDNLEEDPWIERDSG